MAWNGGIKQANFRQELMGALEFEKKFHLLKLKVLPLKTKIVYDTHLNSSFAAAVLGYYTILHMLFIGLPSKNVKMRQLKNYEDKNSAINLEQSAFFICCIAEKFSSS